MNQVAQLSSSHLDEDFNDALHQSYLASVNADGPALLVELDPSGREAVTVLGSRLQEQLIETAGRMLEGMQAEDAAELAEALSVMRLKLQRLASPGGGGASSVGWFGRLLGHNQESAQPSGNLERVFRQIEALVAEVQEHQSQLLAGVDSLDTNYAATLEHLSELDACVGAAEFNLAEIDAQLNMRVVGDDDANDDAREAPWLRGLRITRDELRGRIRDLRLTTQVTRRTLADVRQVRDTEKELIGRVASDLSNALPLWRRQLAQAMCPNCSEASAQGLEVVGLNNDLSCRYALAPREGSLEHGQQIENNDVDAQLFSKANRELIGTVDDDLQIAKEGRVARQRARRALSDMQQELRWSLSAARVTQ